MSNHKLISDLSEEYADSMSAAKPADTSFSRGDIAAAYIIGAEKTLRRVCNVIRESGAVGGLTGSQTERLLGVIELIESAPATSRHG